MTAGTATDVLLWLATYALHSTLFLGAVWLFERIWRRTSPSFANALWRTALLAGIATASLQSLGLVQPIASRLPIAVEQAFVDFEQTVVPGRRPQPSPQLQPTDDATSPRTADKSAQPDSAAIFTAPDAAQGLDLPDRPFPWSETVLAVWGAIVAILALRAALMWWAAHRELADRKSVVHGPLFERIQLIARDVGLKRLPRVSFSDRIAGPFTLPSGEICIPVWAREKLPQHQLDAMLAHEMAHVLHRDSFWLAIGMGVGAVFFFQPLNLVARRRLANLAELAADDWAATRAGSGRPLAECISSLVDIAHVRVSTVATPEFAAAMAKPKSELVQRVERLLNNRYTSGVLPMKTRLLVGACALGFTVVLPGLAAQAHPPQAATAKQVAAAPEAPQVPSAAAMAADVPDLAGAPSAAAAADASASASSAEAPQAAGLEPAPAPEPSPQSHVNISSHGNGELSMNVTAAKSEYSLKAEARGRMHLAPDGSGMESMSGGAYLDATYNKGGQARRVRYTGASGSVQRQFWINGQSQPWGPDADRFISELMPILFRETAIQAEERVDWFLQKRGEDALLSEIGLMDSDTIQRIYSSLYVGKAHLSDARLDQLLNLVQRQMDSDTETRLTLVAVDETQKPTGRQLAHLLGAASTIGSDTETRLVLTGVGQAALNTDEAMAAYLQTARSIGSDTELRLTLWDVVSALGISDGRVQQAIALAGDTIDSDTELRLVLSQAASRVGNSDALAGAYLKAAATIDSSTERRLTLLALTENAKLSRASWRTLLDEAKGIDSSTEKRLVLTGVASKLPREPELVAAWRSAVDSISSDSERRIAASAIPL